MFNEKPSALPQNHLIVMDYDILQSVSQGSDGAQDAENSRIAAIADELERLCAVYLFCSYKNTNQLLSYQLFPLKNL